MSNIVSLDEYRPHLSGEARCIECGHVWVTVAPVGTVELECPNCKTHKGVFIWPTKPDMVWQCGCGNELFYVDPDGAMCARCGERQTFPDD